MTALRTNTTAVSTAAPTAISANASDGSKAAAVTVGQAQLGVAVVNELTAAGTLYTVPTGTTFNGTITVSGTLNGTLTVKAGVTTIESFSTSGTAAIDSDIAVTATSTTVLTFTTSGTFTGSVAIAGHSK